MRILKAFQNINFLFKISIYHYIFYPTLVILMLNHKLYYIILFFLALHNINHNPLKAPL